jgi:hypothetical protein
MSDSGQSPRSEPEALTSQGDPVPPVAAEVGPQLIELPALRMPPAIPELLQLGGHEAFEAYRAAFAQVFFRPLPLIDPQGRVIIFPTDACEHICYHESRFDQSRKRAEGEGRTRDFWDQQRAEHILWLLPALTAPSLIVHNNQVRGNLAYLLGFPTGDHNRPVRRYYASVRPMNANMTRVELKTAYPISQRQWDDAKRGRHGRPHVLYQCKSPRW